MQKHVPELDGLRGIAALMVVLFHAQTILAPASWSTAAVRWSRAGWLGVDLFFALSGYLITRGLLASRSQSRYFARFYGRRVLRIFPLYYLHLGALAVVGRFLPTRFYDPAPGDLALAALYFGNLPDAMGRFPGMCLSPLWSLAVEEWFYLLWPALLWRRSVPRMLAVCAGVFALAVVARWASEATLAPHAAHILTPCRLDGLAAGAVVSLVAHVRGDAAVASWCRARSVLAAIALAVVGLTPFGPRAFQYVYPSDAFQLVGHSVTGIASAVLVGAAGYGASPTPWLRARWLVHVGAVSYGVYLLHAVTGALVVTLAPAVTRLPLEVGAVLLAGATVLVATVVHHVVERPVLALRSRLPWERQSTSTQPAAARSAGASAGAL